MNLIRRKLRMITSAAKNHDTILPVRDDKTFDSCFSRDMATGSLIFWFRTDNGAVHSLTEFQMITDYTKPTY